MISKFIKIKNIGLWRDFSAIGDLALNKVNIIFGENSQGKTTLVSIIRSLVLNKPEFITERKTFGIDNDPYVELLLNGIDNLKFQNNKWSNYKGNLNNVEIFDEFFIDENIYTGLEIQSEHQKRLFQFAIGDEGVNLVREIEELKKDIPKKQEDLNSIKNQLQIITKGYFSENEYINISKDEDIDRKIQEKEKEINIAKESDEIKLHKSLNEIQPLSMPCDFNHLKTLLEKSFDSISEKSLQETIQHIKYIAKILKKDAEPWILKGLLVVEKIDDNKCPFCQQDLNEAKTTIQSYQQYFDEEYKNLKKNIEVHLKQIEGFNVDQLLNEVKNNVLNNNTLFEFWRRFVECKGLCEVRDFEKHCKQIRQYFGEIKLAIENKSKDVLTPINSGCLEDLLKSIDAFNKEVENYNFSINEINKEIDYLKKNQLNIEELKTELEKLKIKKERFQKKNNYLCEKYKTIEKEIDEKKKLVAEKQKTLKESITQKVKKYGDETNKILKKFSVPFRIYEPKQIYRGKGKEPYLEYQLKISDLDVDPLNINKAKFALSGGDRNAFALAFFLAKIYKDGNIADKIIIFDDPISSLDTNRKRRTVELIRNISKDAKQTILFTHHNTFAFELYDYLKNIDITPKCLQIINGALKEWNINEAKKQPFFKDLSRLESFLESFKNNEDVSLDEVRRLIRICLESKLQFNYFQFFKDLGDECWLGSMVTKLRELINEPKLKFKHSDKGYVVDELGNLCNFSSPSHHSNISATYKSDYNREELRNYVELTLKMIYEWL